MKNAYKLNSLGFSLIEGVVTTAIVVIMALGSVSLISDMTKEHTRFKRGINRTSYEQQLISTFKRSDLCSCNFGGTVAISIPAAGSIAVAGLSSTCAGVSTSSWNIYDSSIAGGYPADAHLKIGSITLANPMQISGNDFSATATVTYVVHPELGSLAPAQMILMFTKTSAAGPPYVVSTCTLGGAVNGGGGSGWSLTGNSGTSASNYLGTSDDSDVIFKRNNILGAAIRTNSASFGVNALPSSTGTSNFAFGVSALNGNTTGSYNIGIGNAAGGLAADAIKQDTGNYNIFLGSGSGPSAPGLSNAVAIGYNAKVGASNSLVFGGTGADAIMLGIGTETPSAVLDTKHTIRTNADKPYTVAVRMDVAPTANLAGPTKSAAVLSTVVDDSAFAVDRVSGLTIFLQSMSSSAVSEVNGITTLAHKNGPGSANSVKGLYSSAEALSGTTSFLTSAFTSVTTDAPVTLMTGVLVQTDVHPAAVVTNRYGVYLAPPTGSTATANDYGLYQGGTQKNYFSGPVGLKAATNPTELFEIRPLSAFDSQGIYMETQDGVANSGGGAIEIVLGGGNSNSGSNGTLDISNSQKFVIPSTLFVAHSTPDNTVAALNGTSYAGWHLTSMSNSGSNAPNMAGVGLQSVVQGNGSAGTNMGTIIGTDARAYVGASSTLSRAATVIGARGIAAGQIDWSANSASVGSAYGGHFSVDDQGASSAAGFGVFIGAVEGTTTYSLYASDPSAPSFFAGSVGFNHSDPLEKAHVVGNMRVQGSTDCTLGNGAGATLCESDIRLKTNIREIENPLEKILSLRGVEFEWNEKALSPGRHDIGVIAQEVEKVFPTAVMDEPTTGFKKVDYAVLVAPVIEALKYLSHQFAELFKMFEGHRRSTATLKAWASTTEIETAERRARLEELQGRVAPSEAKP